VVKCGSTDVDVCLRACSLTYPASNAKPYCHLRHFSLHHIFRHYLTNGTILGRKYKEHKMCFNFLYNFYLKHSARYCHKCEKSSCKMLIILIGF
jgi:hypothetical protein